MSNLNSDQFGPDVHMVPVEKVGRWASGDSRNGEWDPVPVIATTKRKRWNPGYEAIRDDIAKNGIQKPLFASSFARPGPVLDDGHHRFAAAVELGLTHVPVTTSWLSEDEFKDHT